MPGTLGSEREKDEALPHPLFIQRLEATLLATQKQQRAQKKRTSFVIAVSSTVGVFFIVGIVVLSSSASAQNRIFPILKPALARSVSAKGVTNTLKAIHTQSQTRKNSSKVTSSSKKKKEVVAVQPEQKSSDRKPVQNKQNIPTTKKPTTEAQKKTEVFANVVANDKKPKKSTVRKLVSYEVNALFEQIKNHRGKIRALIKK